MAYTSENQIKKQFMVNRQYSSGSRATSKAPYLPAMTMYVLAVGMKDLFPWCMLFAGDIVLCSTRREEVETQLVEWIRVMEDRGIDIKKTL